ncbi:hypothetical protein [Thermomonospora catenispora]|uniref:hypothetical protein n=1 Tax=Thermomonospora catenispora TaxID=2493090 RepID=UPI00112206C4|nr:hypothetical protein [Thermomonospora catenispora]TNY36754.1 hypothetical protein EIO00_11910 [Thermomonospora catenispora]
MTLAERLRDSKTVHTVAGAGDLAVEKLREVPEQVGRLRENVTRYQDEMRVNVTKLQGGVRENMIKLQEEVRENVTRLQERVESADLRELAGAYVAQVQSMLDELAERGKKVVARVENQAATRELTESAKRTRRKTRAAVGEAGKTARAARRTAGDASKKVGD